MKQLIVIFIDEFKEKNRLQHEIIQELGFNATWFQTSNLKKSDIESIEILKNSFWARIKQVSNFLKSHKDKIHHIEIYPGGRFSFIYLLLAKILGIRSLCCERGDIYFYVNKKYDIFTRISQYVVYKFSDYIWLRELFAIEYLEKIKIKRPYFFIHNVVPIPDLRELKPLQEKEIDFLWVNTLKSFRRVEWFDHALNDTCFNQTKNVLLGNIKNDSNKLLSTISEKSNLELHDFVSPELFYQNAKFFVMPASIVYLNHALLEAMSYGVVPIITEAEGADLIIEHNKDGFICDYSENEFLNAMKKALSITSKNYEELSFNARQKVIQEYSRSYYFKELEKMYQSISTF